MSHTSNMSRHARRGAKHVRNAARHLRDVAEHEQNGILHTVQKVGNEAVDAVREGYEGLRDGAADYVEQGRAKVESMEQSLEREIKQRPFTSIMVGTAVGFLLGCLFSRR